MSLVDTYGIWSDFQRRHPGRYGRAVTEEIEAVLEKLTESTCACGDLATVEREQRVFVSKFPDSRHRPAAVKRLNALRNGHLKVPERCISGCGRLTGRSSRHTGGAEGWSVQRLRCGG